MTTHTHAHTGTRTRRVSLPAYYLASPAAFWLAVLAPRPWTGKSHPPCACVADGCGESGQPGLFAARRFSAGAAGLVAYYIGFATSDEMP